MNRNLHINPKRRPAPLPNKSPGWRSVFLLLIFCLFSYLPFASAQERDPFAGVDEIKAKVLPDKNRNKPLSKDDIKIKKEEAPRTLPAQVSEHIMKLATEERKKRMNFMLVVIEDVSRLCELNEKQQEHLTLAAKGASERSMKKWHTQAETYFNTRIKNQNKDAIKKILSSIGNVNFGGRDTEKESESEDLWKDTLKDVLSEDQVKKYEEVVTRRRKQQVAAYAQVSLAALDNFLRLTPEQNAKLKVIVTEAADNYLEEVKRYWGNYYESKMLMSLANATDLEALKKILTERQFERHMAATTNYDQFWDQKRKLKKAKAKSSIKKEAEKLKETKKE